MNKLVLPVAIVVVLIGALASSVIGLDGLASIGIERFTAEQLEDGSVKSTMDVDVAQKLGSFANLIFGALLTVIAWVKGWINSIAQWVANLTSDSKPKQVDEEGREVAELPEDRKEFIEDMLLDAVYARDRRKTILWCHELASVDYLTKDTVPAKEPVSSQESE